MTRYAACIEYDGSDFSGWQAQKHDVRTVQETLEKALTKVADEPIATITAGRTDSRVHATHQVVHFDSLASRSNDEWLRGGNRFLDQDLRICWLKPVADSFHARFSATSRSYRYIIYHDRVASAILRRQVTHTHLQLDIDVMRKAAAHLLGEHDFSSFRAAGCQAHSPVRTISELELFQFGPWIWFDVRANAFLQHMVRNIAGCLIAVGSGKYDSGWVKTVLEMKDRTKGDVTALPSGLYLTGVEYPPEYDLPSVCRKLSFWGMGDSDE